MGIISWLILGALAGWIASKIAGTDASMGMVANIVVGIAGALIGGFLANILGATEVTGLNPWSLLISVVGAVILLGFVKAFRGKAV